MKRTAAIVMTVLGVLSVPGTVAAATPPAALAALPCDGRGVPAADGWNANQLAPALNGRMRGGLSAYRISCARVVTEIVRSRGLSFRAAEIALTTIIVEATMDNLNTGHGSSIGLFQQTISSYPNINRNDPVAATNAFLNEMLRIYPNGSWATRPIGEVCQAVQRSGYPERYQPEAHDGSLIAGAVWDRSPSSIAVYRSAQAKFFIRKLNGASPPMEVSFGLRNDLPAVGHYENSNFDNLAVYRQSDSAFHIRKANGDPLRIGFGDGTKGDLPAPGRFESNRYDNLAVFRPSNGTFYIRKEDGSTMTVPFPNAREGDVPAIGHYENSNFDNLAVYRRSEGAFYIRWASGKVDKIPFGNPGDLPAPGHFQAGRYTNLAVYRPSTSTFHIRMADLSAQPVVLGDGSLGDRPAIGKFE
ncbi:hypothetical protein [Nonomuraea sp. LPB2021202275-12-8]|uniref:hypothetical protein n=1 Tax=Nonomuraea sp. LPB2021202275-12-8 TaxID=3120159 RepID=UPI00300CCE2E